MYSAEFDVEDVKLGNGDRDGFPSVLANPFRFLTAEAASFIDLDVLPSDLAILQVFAVKAQ